MKAVSLNHQDLHIANGKYCCSAKEDVIPVSDASSEVIKVGSSVTDLEVGDRAIASFYPETLFGPMKYHNSAFGAVNTISKNSHLAHEEASVLVCTDVTAWNTLYGSDMRFIAGQTVLILGTGGVAITSLVLVKAAGAVTVITSSSDVKLKYAKEKYGPDYTKKVLEITDGEGVDFIIEYGGNGNITKSIKFIKYGGQISLVGFLAHYDSLPDVVLGLLMKGATTRGIKVGSKQLAGDLIRMVYARKLSMPVEKMFGFSEEEVHATYANLQSQAHIGKTVIKVN